MASVTSAICNSWKAEIMQGVHCMSAPQALTCGTTNTSPTITSSALFGNIVVGMGVSGTGIPANATVIAVASTSSLTISANATATNASISLTFSGDGFQISLILNSESGTYGAGTTNYSQLGSDEVATGSGYARPGLALTNITPAVSSNTAWTTFNNTPATQWTSASFSVVGCLISNSTARMGGVGGGSTNPARAVAVFNFGTQTVSSGTLTITYPQTANGLLSIT